MTASDGALTARATFASPDLEERYRVDRLGGDLKLMRFLLAVSLAATAALVRMDLLLSRQALDVLLAAHAVKAAAVLAFIVASWRGRWTPRRFDAWTFAVCLVAAAHNFLVIAYRPEAYSGQIVPCLFVTLVVYMILPLQAAAQAALSLFFGLGCVALALAGHPALSAPAETMLIVCFAAANALGAAASWHLHGNRRRLFLALAAESDLRGKLETALAEIKTLRGILPICAHCKRVRDEEQNWHAVEDYVRVRTHARFSHGVCPDCEQKHYSHF